MEAENGHLGKVWKVKREAFDEVEPVGARKQEGKNRELRKWFRVTLWREWVQEQTKLQRRRAVKWCEKKQQILERLWKTKKPET